MSVGCGYMCCGLFCCAGRVLACMAVRYDS